MMASPLGDPRSPLKRRPLRAPPGDPRSPLKRRPLRQPRSSKEAKREARRFGVWLHYTPTGAPLEAHEFLCVQQVKNAAWGIPKGEIEAWRAEVGEECAVRELFQETGVSMSVEQMLQAHEKTLTRWSHTIYVVAASERCTPRVLDPKEIRASDWKTLDQLRRLKLTEATKYFVRRTQKWLQQSHVAALPTLRPGTWMATAGSPLLFAHAGPPLLPKLAPSQPVWISYTEPPFPRWPLFYTTFAHHHQQQQQPQPQPQLRAIRPPPGFGHLAPATPAAAAAAAEPPLTKPLPSAPSSPASDDAGGGDSSAACSCTSSIFCLYCDSPDDEEEEEEEEEGEEREPPPPLVEEAQARETQQTGKQRRGQRQERNSKLNLVLSSLLSSSSDAGKQQQAASH
jgi:ADP-ribose pyrophosphatase YjhB (NUDIX family)